MLVAAAALALAVPAPASVGASGITVYAAASLTDVLPRVDGTARFSFGGSDQLAFQIREGAPADVYAAASPKHPRALYRERIVLRPRVFATNRLVLIVPRANPARLRSVLDLRRRGIKLVLAQAGVPVGDYTRIVLRNLGLSGALRNAVSQEPDVRGVVAKVALGEADAGFVYATDARAARRRVSPIEIPRRAQPPIRYEIAVVRSTRRVAGARAFVARVLGRAGRRELARAGFGLP